MVNGNEEARFLPVRSDSLPEESARPAKQHFVIEAAFRPQVNAGTRRSKGDTMMPRTFRARNMPAALEAMQQEMGPGALVISVHRRPAGRGWRKRPSEYVEVTAIPSAVATSFGFSNALPSAASPGKRLPSPKENHEKQKRGATKEDWTDPSAPCFSTRPQQGTADKAPDQPLSAYPLIFSSLRGRLLSQGVEPSYVEYLIRSTFPSGENEKTARERIRRQLHARLTTENGVQTVREGIWCIVGINGSGKTSLCAKLAAHAVRVDKKNVRWITTDTLRAGAIAKARAFTASLGIPLRLAYTAEELKKTTTGLGENELILIDTPGCNPYRTEEIRDLGALLEAIPKRHTLLVIPATGKEEDLEQVAAGFLPLGVDGLAVTKMDETCTYGGVYNFACRCQPPILFFTSGPCVMTDLQSAESAILLDALLGLE